MFPAAGKKERLFSHAQNPKNSNRCDIQIFRNTNNDSSSWDNNTVDSFENDSNLIDENNFEYIQES